MGVFGADGVKRHISLNHASPLAALVRLRSSFSGARPSWTPRPPRRRCSSSFLLRLQGGQLLWRGENAPGLNLPRFFKVPVVPDHQPRSDHGTALAPHLQTTAASKLAAASGLRMASRMRAALLA